MAGRFTKYKNKGLDCSELRRRREETGIQLRRAKREEEFIKRRFVDPDGCTIEEPSNQYGQGGINSIRELIVEVMSDDPIKQLRSTQVFRKLLSQEPSPPIEDVIQYGVVPRFVHFLQQHENSVLQFEAAWALTNVASGNSSQTRHIIDVGGIPVLLQLLTSNHDDVLEQAVWALGNIAGDSAECRDIVLQHGIMDPLLALLQRSLKLSLVRNAVWCLSNLCRGKNPPPSFDQVSPCLPTLSRLLFHNDADVLADSCWAVTHLSDGPNHKIQAVIESGICRRLVELLMHEDQNVVCAALRAVGNIVTGDDVQTQVILNCSVLPSLLHLLGKGSESLRKEVCWTISNITAGNRDQVQAVINANIVPALVETLNMAEFQTRKEAAWAITNATCGGSPDQVRYLANVGCVSPLCDLLSVSQPKIVLVALNGINNILKVGNRSGGAKKGVNPYSLQVEECFGLNKIEYLLHHENVDIANKASEILDHYFREEEPLPEEFHEFASTTTENLARTAAVPSEGFSL